MEIHSYSISSKLKSEIPHSTCIRAKDAYDQDKDISSERYMLGYDL